MADRGHADADQIVGRQLQQHLGVDLVTAWARQQVAERFGDSGYELHFTIYGRNATSASASP